MHSERGFASLLGPGAKPLEVDDVFVSETLIFDALMIVFNKITILMTCMYNNPLKIYALCNNTR